VLVPELIRTARVVELSTESRVVIDQRGDCLIVHYGQAFTLKRREVEKFLRAFEATEQAA